MKLLPPNSPQFLALVPAILVAAVLKLPEAPDLEALASVLRQAVVGPTTPTKAPSISFAIPAPISKSQRAAAPPRVPDVPPQTRSPTLTR